MAKFDGHRSEKRRYCCENVSFSHREDYKRLRTNIRFCLSGSANCSVLGITSAKPTDGKSLTAINLAYSFAQIPDKRVLLVDCDMRRPSVSTKLGFQQAPGLSNLISGVEESSGGEIKNVYKPSDGSCPFDVLTSGRIPPNPSELLACDRMKRLMEQLRSAYDFIILDLPPVGAVTDAQVASELTDGMLVVVRESYCARPVLDECLHQLSLSNARILGFILNGSVETTRAGYRYKKYSRYGKGYSYGGYYGNSYGYGYGYGGYYGYYGNPGNSGNSGNSGNPGNSGSVPSGDDSSQSSPAENPVKGNSVKESTGSSSNKKTGFKL